MRNSLVCSLTLVATFALAAGCVHEETSDESDLVTDELKPVRGCKGNPKDCDAGADAATADATPPPPPPPPPPPSPSPPSDAGTSTDAAAPLPPAPPPPADAGLVDAAAPAPAGPRDYKTFDGTSLLFDRKVAPMGIDLKRVKPFSALQSELPRVLGSTPASLAGAAATFGAPPVRWYEEPEVSAVSLQTSLDVAFDGCLTYTAADAKYGTAPTAATATTECTAMARKFWSRAPAATELTGCINVATTATAAEPNARRKWAYACAAVLSATGFLTY